MPLVVAAWVNVLGGSFKHLVKVAVEHFIGHFKLAALHVGPDRINVLGHLADRVFADRIHAGMLLCYVDVVEVWGRLHGGGLSSIGSLARVELRGVVLALPRFALGNQGGDLVLLLRDLELELVLVVLLAYAAADGVLAILQSLLRLHVLVRVCKVVVLDILVDELRLNVLALLASQLEVSLVGVVVLLRTHFGLCDCGHRTAALDEIL